jgi:tyrosyl-tRNA synthetase
MPEYFRLLLGGEVPAGPPNEAKRELGRRIVERYHGAESARRAEEHFDRLFVRHEPPAEMEEVDLSAFLSDGGSLVHLPLLMAGAFEISSSEARRLLREGGVKLDGEPLDGDKLDIDPSDLDGRVLQLGKRRFRRIRSGA